MNSGSSAPIGSGSAGRRLGRQQRRRSQWSRPACIGTVPPVFFTTMTRGDRRADRQRLVRIGLQRHLAAAAAAFIGGDQDRAFAVLDARGQAVRREAAEDDGMHRADPGAGQHRHRGLDDHRQVDADPVALLHAEAAQRIGQAADPLVQLAVGDLGFAVRVVALPDDRHLVAAGRQMPVEAGDGGVEHAVLEPLDGTSPVKSTFLILRRRRHPGDAAGLLLRPEGVRIASGGLGHGPVLLGRDQRLGGDLRLHGDQVSSDILGLPSGSIVCGRVCPWRLAPRQSGGGRGDQFDRQPRLAAQPRNTGGTNRGSARITIRHPPAPPPSRPRSAPAPLPAPRRRRGRWCRRHPRSGSGRHARRR